MNLCSVVRTAVERAPAVLEVDRHRLRVGVLRALAIGLEHQRHQGLAVERLRRLDAHQVEHRRQDIDGPHLGGHPDALEVGARHADDQRHPHGGVVDVVAVLVLAVVAEALAVVAHHHDDRVVGDSPCSSSQSNSLPTCESANAISPS